VTKRARSLFEAEARARVRAVLERAGEQAGARVLFAFDVDGTIAPIVAKLAQARVPAATLRVLDRLTRRRGVTVALVSARSRRVLRRLVPLPRARVAAQYGLEGVVAPAATLRKRWRRGAARIAAALVPVAAASPGAVLERKSMAVALHDRGVAQRRLPALRRAVRRAASAARPLGFAPVRGHRVTEFVPRGYDKGRAMVMLRKRYAPAVVFYFGDSEADEPAFAVLGRNDFPVRVGPGPTRARYRVRGPTDVTRFLRSVVSLRPGFGP
jgi:trehalose 6-phosphate phosphatase